MSDNKNIAYGKDELTFSINFQENKAEDWMADWSGRVVVEGKTYFLNGYIKKEGWVAGRLKPEDSNNFNKLSQSNPKQNPALTHPPLYNEEDDNVIPF